MVPTVAVIMQVKHIVFIPRIGKTSIPVINADKMEASGMIVGTHAS